jgi:hypothetical protein
MRLNWTKERRLSRSEEDVKDVSNCARETEEEEEKRDTKRHQASQTNK